MTGRIFDIKGQFVAQTARPVSNSLLWDGKSGGVIVPSGVYLPHRGRGAQVHRHRPHQIIPINTQ